MFEPKNVRVSLFEVFKACDGLHRFFMLPCGHITNSKKISELDHLSLKNLPWAFRQRNAVRAGDHHSEIILLALQALKKVINAKS
jgi:hypothetical protein